MVSDIRKHPMHYSILAFLLIITLTLMYLVSYSGSLMLAVAILGASMYVAWGILHHHLTDDLTAEIVFEYVILALLVVVLFAVSV